MTKKFNYSTAFSRNIGWVTALEQELLRTKTIAIAGMGGVGGSHLLTLARLGVGSFHLSDHDVFELANFNRQAGANLKTIGINKVETLANMALDINPDLEIRSFPMGLDAMNTRDFLEDSDLYVDGLDFFAVEARRRVFSICAEMEIPAITAAPLGMGAALLNFLPGHMTFEEYFRLEGHAEKEQLLRFFVGLAPAGLQQKYLVDSSTIDLAGHKGPSTPMGCELCAGVAATQALKILLGRGTVLAAPHGLQFDAFANKVAHTWRPGGNRHPLQRIALSIGRKKILHQDLNRETEEIKVEIPKTVTEHILDLARWAPSGDNSQPWRFTIRSENEFTVILRDQSDTDVYDYNNGQPTLLSGGMLLESIRIAATQYSKCVEWKYRESKERNHFIDIELLDCPDLSRDPLYPFLRHRSVNRGRYRREHLSDHEKRILENSLGNGYRLSWQENFAERFRVARINARATDIRLRIPEAFAIHQKILDWNRYFSPEGVPAQAIGLDPVTLKMMRWVMQNWRRADLMNRFLGGTLIPRLSMDLVPGISCAAHFIVESERAIPDGAEIPFFLHAGQALQRFWLTATRLGLVVHPSLAPLCFAFYGDRKISFTQDKRMQKKAEFLTTKLKNDLSQEPDSVLFLGRIGLPLAYQLKSRSVRRALHEMMDCPDSR